ncbi:NAD(+) synthase [bacterium]|nr:NAD(+) synthase [bacterium]
MEIPTLDLPETSKKIIDFLKKEFDVRNKENAILALSGGIDSATCALLCKRAGLNIIAVILPYGRRGCEGKKMARFLGLPAKNIITVDIAPLVDRTVKVLNKIIKMDKIDIGNVMARERMIIQYALARKLNGLVIGTENLSEYYLGYFTLHGDQACDISPIAGLLKTHVYEVAKFLEAPQWILEKKPTAGFWKGQTDEKELGFSYQEADPIIYFYTIKGYSRSQIIKKGLNKELVDKVLERIKSSEYKRHSPPKILFY